MPHPRRPALSQSLPLPATRVQEKAWRSSPTPLRAARVVRTVWSSDSIRWVSTLTRHQIAPDRSDRDTRHRRQGRDAAALWRCLVDVEGEMGRQLATHGGSGVSIQSHPPILRRGCISTLSSVVQICDCSSSLRVNTDSLGTMGADKN